MGKQAVEGTIGNMAFYKSKNGYMARMKTGVSDHRILNDPVNARTRENMAEFSRAGKAGKQLRIALAGSIQQVKDSGMTARLTREMMKVLKADVTSTRGQRNVIDGEAELLQGFEFNAASPLATTLFAPATAPVQWPGNGG
ncbi:hypothetical protein GA0116948_10141 [Chitinophaga costaii]|uniref:Uncharacterized protein n=1 Tax=Chitinophaga costaii TaxID=1335309 RepID=A0A1C3YQ85_9BACT|nr:hypothetical protein [Chitinophaga costaii]PUZ30053.1 hypothetical protein DCM91_00805 [Chitinophaga costaii]SCB72249.1 hypothetical protein GA0116948_10141 [Chitinophaga costaii]